MIILDLINYSSKFRPFSTDYCEFKNTRLASKIVSSLISIYRLKFIKDLITKLLNIFYPLKGDLYIIRV